MIRGLKRIILSIKDKQSLHVYSQPEASYLLRPQDSFLGVRLQGGLGNQLFQFAAALELALLFKKKLILNDDALRLDSKRTFCLDFFGLEVNFPYEVDLVDEKLSFKKAIQTKPILWHEIRESHFHYAQVNALEVVSKDCLLIGYFQSDKYFSTFEKFILDYLRGFLLSTDSEELVAHIRRGDFLDPGTRSYHGILADDYYIRALRLFPTVTQLKLVCEDLDINNTILALSREFPELEIQKYEESTDSKKSFSFMAKSNNLIIANSSFSWWAGKLSQNSSHQVVAPRNYFSQETLRMQNTCDLYPEGWIVI